MASKGQVMRFWLRIGTLLVIELAKKKNLSTFYLYVETLGKKEFKGRRLTDLVGEISRLPNI